MLHLHRAERSDTLADALADVLAEPPADPFTAEVVAVPARGMERWLAHRLAHRLGTAAGRGDGVCAHVVFPSPGDVVAAALDGASGVATADNRGSRRARCGRSWRSSTPARAARGVPRWPPTWIGRAAGSP